VSAADIATQIRLWAVANGLMAREQLGPSGETQLAAAALGKLEPVPKELPTMPRGFAISFVGFNEVTKEVIVYSTKPVRKKLLQILPKKGAGNISISYQVGVNELIGKLPPPPFGAPAAALHKGRYTCGSSIHVGNRIGAGTLGCLVRGQDGTIYGLSNSHVSGNCGYASNGFPILAPGPIDVGIGGVDPFCVGHHHEALRMVHGAPDNPTVHPADNTDAAIFKINDPTKVTSMQKGGAYDTPNGVAKITPQMKVRKVGRTTGLTEGIVRAQVSGPHAVRYKMAELDIDLTVFYEPVFVVEATQGAHFSWPGDSGALVIGEIGVNRTAGVGLILSGDTTKGVSHVLPLEPILQKLKVTLVSGHHV
jgi:hypothetical protein